MLSKIFKNMILGMKHQRRFISVKSYTDDTTPKSLNDLLRQRIKATGPITVAKFMTEVLTNPLFGYYTTKDAIGRQGDFITSPEISQLFSELTAIWFLNEWGRVGSPNPFNFVELGPGRGTMVAYVLDVFRKFKFSHSMSIHLIEISDIFSDIQAEKLGVTIIPLKEHTSHYKHGKTEDGIEVFWYRRVIDYKHSKFSLILAHEFFDALPIHKFKKTKDGWCEVLVDIDHNDPSGKKYRYVLSEGPTPRCKIFISPEETRDEIEICSEGMLHMGYLASLMETYGGIALVIDYGHCGTKSDTFRACRDHKQCDPLVDVGNADLTADVDFLSLRRAVHPKLVSFGPVTQRQFLKEMYIDVRLENLLEKCIDEKTKEYLKLGYHTLIDEDKMGSQFFFMSFFPAVLQKILEKYPVPGFLEANK